ncbi:MAG: hypothetical protein ACFNZQ_04680 [Scardovia wiggsiae]|uniref:hypothetical protein n=1 Tax=Scardovia wiggsiae TaxID=230143 RepID=UPI00360CE349
MKNSRKIIACTVAAILAAVGLAGCSATPTSTGSGAGTSKTAAAKPTPTIGDSDTNGTLTLKFDAYEEPETVEYRELGNLTGTPKQPDEGMKWIVGTFTLTNNGKKSVDPVCGTITDIKAVDDKEREYDVFNELYAIRDNHDCMTMQQPGTSQKVTYVFSAPKDTKILGFKWYDNTDYPFHPKYSYFVTDKAYHLPVA